AQHDAEIARLDTGKLLIVGGEAVVSGSAAPAVAQVFDPATQTFTALSAQVVRAHAAVASRGSQVLVAGGRSSIGVEASAEVFDAATSTFAQGVALTAARERAS